MLNDLTQKQASSLRYFQSFFPTSFRKFLIFLQKVFIFLKKIQGEQRRLFHKDSVGQVRMPKAALTKRLRGSGLRESCASATTDTPDLF